jgi:hypothetical protein
MAAGVVLVLGVGALLAIPIAISPTNPFTFRQVFTIYLLLVVPVMVLLAMNRSQYTLDKIDIGAGSPSSYGEWELRRFQVTGAILMDLLMWGPRAVLAGVATLRGNAPDMGEALCSRAACVVEQLLQHESAIRVRDAVPHDALRSEWVPVLFWMERHDVIGLSADRQRVWLSSAARKEFAELGLAELPARRRVVPAPPADGLSDPPATP